MMGGSILLVDDEAKIRQGLGKVLKDEGYEVVAAGTGRDAQRLLSERAFDLLVIDNLMPELSGLDVIREIAATLPAADRPQIVMMTAYATVDSAIEAMKLGALDYLQKPFEIEEFLVVVKRAVEHERLRVHRDYLLGERDEHFDHYGIVGRSRAIMDVVRTAKLVAQSRSTILIAGETGTGKELVAPRFMTGARKRTRRSCASTARRCRTRSSSPSCSVTSAARSPGPWETRRAGSPWPTAVRFFWTRSAPSRSPRSPSCFEYCRNANSSRWGQSAPSRWTYASSPRPTATWPPSWRPAGSSRISTIG
jgi:DNA-binding response OmpR family regulator